MKKQIVDLILPDTFDTENAKKELIKNYNYLWWDTDSPFEEWFPIFAPIFVRELKEIENSQTKYDRTFWEKVIELNDKTLNIINWRFNIDDKYVEFDFRDKIDCTPYFNFNELDLINKQYRLLQEIYYSRLEEK